MSFLGRLIDTARLRPLAYEAVEEDTRARDWWQPVVIVALSGVGLAAAEYGRIGPVTAAYAAVTALAGWLLWSGLTFAIGVRLLPGRATYATWGQLLRTTGFATGPGILGFLGLFTVLTGFAAAVLGVWILIAAVVAVRQALDYTSVWPALAVCVLGWLIYFGLTWIIVSRPY